MRWFFKLHKNIVSFDLTRYIKYKNKLGCIGKTISVRGKICIIQFLESFVNKTS